MNFVLRARKKGRPTEYRQRVVMVMLLLVQQAEDMNLITSWGQTDVNCMLSSDVFNASDYVSLTSKSNEYYLLCR